MRPLPIWLTPSERHVVLRHRLPLSEPCRDGEVRCHASGPFHLYLNGVRHGGGTGGQLLSVPQSETVPLEGAWDSGTVELLVVVDGADAVSPWFWCEGKLHHTQAERTTSFCTGVDWQGRPRRQDPPAGVTAFERLLATDAPAAAGAWEGVLSPGIEAGAGEAIVSATEKLVRPATLLAVGAVPAGSGPADRPGSLAASKCVHHDALLANGRGSTQVRTAPAQSVVLQFDLGALVVGWPALRLRGGAGGIVDIFTAPSREAGVSQLRYHCGEGRQAPVGLRQVACRYLTLHLTGFEAEELAIEAVGVLQRSLTASPMGQIEVDDAMARAWDVGAASLRALRQETYVHPAGPGRYDWLAGWILARNELVQTGSPHAAVQALAACEPAAPYHPHDLAHGLALADAVQHAGFELSAEALHRTSRTLTTIFDAVEATHVWPATAVAALALCAVEALAALDPEETNESPGLDALRARCRQALEAAWHADSGLFADNAGTQAYSQWVNGLALLAIGEDERAAGIESAMRRAGVEPASDPLRVWLLTAGLGAAHRTQRMLDVIGNHWQRRLEREGGTWHEKWPGVQLVPGPESLWIRHLFGVRPLAPAWTVREVRPAIALFERASATVPLDESEAMSLAWAPAHDEDGDDADAPVSTGTRIRLRIDREGETHLRIDRAGRRRPTITVNGDVVWRNEKIYPNPIVHMIAAEEDHVLLVLERAGAFSILVD